MWLFFTAPAPATSIKVATVMDTTKKADDLNHPGWISGKDNLVDLFFYLTTVPAIIYSLINFTSDLALLSGMFLCTLSCNVHFPVDHQRQ